MLIIYYGNGKGKTTAALGVALRASGYGKKILFAQFVKSPKSFSGEDKSLKSIPNLVHKKFGLGFVGLLQDSHLLEEHRQAALKGLKYILKNQAEFEIVVLDEILGAIKGGLLRAGEVEEVLKNANKDQHLILTGRPKYKKLLQQADLVTEMQEIKHPFRKGQLAQKGVDY